MRQELVWVVVAQVQCPFSLGIRDNVISSTVWSWHLCRESADLKGSISGSLFSPIGAILL